MPTLRHSDFYRPDAFPATPSIKALKAHDKTRHTNFKLKFLIINLTNYSLKITKYRLTCLKVAVIPHGAEK